MVATVEVAATVVVAATMVAAAANLVETCKESFSRVRLSGVTYHEPYVWQPCRGGGERCTFTFDSRQSHMVHIKQNSAYFEVSSKVSRSWSTHVYALTSVAWSCVKKMVRRLS